MIEAIVVLLIATIAFTCGMYVSEAYNRRIFIMYSHYAQQQVLNQQLHNEMVGYKYNPLNDVFMGHLKANKRATVLMNKANRV